MNKPDSFLLLLLGAMCGIIVMVVCLVLLRGAPGAKPDVVSYTSESGQVECAVLVYKGRVEGFSCVPVIPSRAKRGTEMEIK